MQNTLFDIEQVAGTSSIKLHNGVPSRSGAKNAVSRYSGLKQQLDQDKIYNWNWREIDTRITVKSESDIYFMDLFSGAGGISTGARMAGLKKIASVEIDPDASNTIRKNFPESVHFEMPIEHLTETMLDKKLAGQKPNIILGGPPCQGFSVAGLRKPDDPRNQLFHQYIRIVRHL